MVLENYTSVGGIHPETAVIKNILDYHQIVSPHNDQSFSEEMLLGIGGGLGSCYILWEFERHGYPSIVLAFQNKSNYSVKFLQNLCGRLNATTEVFETGGKKKAETQLLQSLESENPAIIWIDMGSAPYYMHYLSVGVAVVYGYSDNQYKLDNRAKKPYLISSENMIAIRAKVPSFKNRIMTVQPSSDPIDIHRAIRDGIKDCIDYLNASSTSFALPAIRKWARMMTDQKNKKGWPTVFKGGRGLYGTLRTVYEGIEHTGTGGGGMRGMYAEFLKESAKIFSCDELAGTAAIYTKLNELWQDLARAALPDNIPEFQQTKKLIDDRAKIIQAEGGEGIDRITPFNDKLHEIKSELNDDFPLSESETSHLFVQLQERLFELFNLEKEALVSLEKSFEKIS